jgi:hypothetical protein
MSAIALSWDLTYRHDRRRHRHRCLSCGRIVEAGEQVVMAKIGDRKTRVLHASPCADKVCQTDERSGEPWTWRKLIEEQAREHYQKLGRLR